MGIRDKPTAPASPWQNGFTERLSLLTQGPTGFDQFSGSVVLDRAATAKAPEASGDEPWVGGAFFEKEGNQMLADAALQSWWNSRAALFATAAAIFTALDTVLY
jgi:hypothetical protein